MNKIIPTIPTILAILSWIIPSQCHFIVDTKTGDYHYKFFGFRFFESKLDPKVLFNFNNKLNEEKQV